MARSPDFLVRIAIAACRRAACVSVADDGAARQLDLEGVVLVAFGVAQQEVGGVRESACARALAAQRRFGRRIAPRLVRDAAERQARLLDRAAFKFQRGRDRYQRERIGQPVADLQVSVVRRKALRRQLDRGDDLVGCRLVSSCGVSPGSRWKSANAIARSPAGPATWTMASSAASATHMSEGCVAMQASLVPRIAWMRLMPLMAEQPLPGSRLLQGVAVS